MDSARTQTVTMLHPSGDDHKYINTYIHTYIRTGSCQARNSWTQPGTRQQSYSISQIMIMHTYMHMHTYIHTYIRTGSCRARNWWTQPGTRQQSYSIPQTTMTGASLCVGFPGRPRRRLLRDSSTGMYVCLGFLSVFVRGFPWKAKEEVAQRFFNRYVRVCMHSCAYVKNKGGLGVVVSLCICAWISLKGKGRGCTGIFRWVFVCACMHMYMYETCGDYAILHVCTWERVDTHTRAHTHTTHTYNEVQKGSQNW